MPFSYNQSIAQEFFFKTKEEALSSITLNAAKILGIADRTGSIETGKDANIVISEGDILDMRSSNISLVMIGGRMVVENRKLLTVDVAGLAAKAEKSRERRAAANKPAKALYDRLEKIVGTFCPGLAKQPLHIDRFGGGHHHGYGHMPHKH